MCQKTSRLKLNETIEEMLNISEKSVLLIHLIKNVNSFWLGF